MTILLTLLRKDLLLFFRNKAALVLTFLVPIALIFVFGQIFGLTGATRGPGGIRLAVVNASPLPAAQKLVEQLAREPAFEVVRERRRADGSTTTLTVEDVRELIHQRELRFGLIIPEDVVSAERIGVRLQILSDPRNQIEAEMTLGLLQKAVFTATPELLGHSLQLSARQALGAAGFATFNRNLATAIGGAFDLDPSALEARLAAGDLLLAPGAGYEGNDQSLTDLVQIETEQVVGREVKNPEATRIIAGYAIMFLLFAISGSSASFFDEKSAGLFQRVLAAPVSRAQLLGGRFLFGVVLGLIQLGTLFMAGSLMFGIDIASHVGPLVVVGLAAASACASFGLLIAAVAPNAQAASGLATFVIMMMSAMGGAWFPLSIMPAFMQLVGKFTLVYWAVEGFQQVLWAGNSLVEVLPIVGVLLGITTVVMAVAIWRLQRKPLFD